MNGEMHSGNNGPRAEQYGATDPCEFAGQTPLEWPVPPSRSRPNLVGIRQTPVTFWASEEEPGRYTSFETHAPTGKGISYRLSQYANEIGDLRWRLVAQEWGRDVCVLTDHHMLKFAPLPELLAAMGVLAREGTDLTAWAASDRKELGYVRTRWKAWLKAVPSWVMRFEE